MEIALWFAKQANMYLCTDSLNLVGQLIFQFWCYWGKNDPLRYCKGVIRLAREGKWSHLSLLGRKVGTWIFLPLHSHSYSGQLSRIISRQVSAEVGEKPKQNLWKAFNTNLSGLYWKLRTVKSGWAQAFGVNTAAFGASLSSCWQFVPLMSASPSGTVEQVEVMSAVAIICSRVWGDPASHCLLSSAAAASGMNNPGYKEITRWSQSSQSVTNCKK